MRFLGHSLLTLVPLACSVTAATTSWSFEDASVSVVAKGGNADSVKTQKLSPSSPISSAVRLSASDTLTIALTTIEGKTGKRPHQAFLTLREAVTGLEESFVFALKGTGKGKVEVTQQELPHQFLTSKSPIKASIVLGSFGASAGLDQHVLDITIDTEGSAISPQTPAERYASKPEIHHIFRSDPRSPPTLISLTFALAVIAALPALFLVWLSLGGNLAHFGKAFQASPVAHGVFLGSIVAMEAVFFMYYVSWNLFQTLPVAGVVAVVAYISGSKALTEVQDRRLAGQR